MYKKNEFKHKIEIKKHFTNYSVMCILKKRVCEASKYEQKKALKA